MKTVYLTAVKGHTNKYHGYIELERIHYELQKPWPWSSWIVVWSDYELDCDRTGEVFDWFPVQVKDQWYSANNYHKEYLHTHGTDVLCCIRTTKQPN